jgi:hypothetical protein
MWAKGFLAHHRCKLQMFILAIIGVHRGGQTKGTFAHPTRVAFFRKAGEVLQSKRSLECSEAE